MDTSVAISMIVFATLIIGGFVMYRRYVTSLHAGSEIRQINGARLTSETLQQLPAPPWRCILEIGEDRLGGIDHVIIGPPGIIAVSTLMLDRPAAAKTPDPQQMVSAAMMRSPVDELAARAGLSCDTLAKVYWGVPQPGQPAALSSGAATAAVEGQRLTEWLHGLPARPVTQGQIDLAWQAMLTGIGRPDPLT